MKRAWHIAKYVCQLGLGTLVAAPFFLVLFGGLFAVVGALGGFENALAIGKAMCGLGGVGIALLFFTDVGQVAVAAFNTVGASAGKAGKPDSPSKNARSYGRGMWRSSTKSAQAKNDSTKPNRFWGL